MVRGPAPGSSDIQSGTLQLLPPLLLLTPLSAVGELKGLCELCPDRSEDMATRYTHVKRGRDATVPGNHVSKCFTFWHEKWHRCTDRAREVAERERGLVAHQLSWLPAVYGRDLRCAHAYIELLGALFRPAEVGSKDNDKWQK